MESKNTILHHEYEGFFDIKDKLFDACQENIIGINICDRLKEMVIE
jgi:hypothetical protein